MDPETRWARAKLTGMMMQSLRQAFRMDGRKARLSQENLLVLMGQADSRYFNAYDRSTVSKWETGEVLPTVERLEVFGSALNLSRAEIDGLIVLAGLEPEAQNPPVESTSGSREAAAIVAEPSAPAGNAASDRLAGRSYAGEFTWFVLTRFLLPGLGIAGAGYLLATVGWSSDWMMTVYVVVVLAMVLAHYLLRMRRPNHLRELYLVSTFVLLTTPLLLVPLIRMDPYGFYAIEGFANTPMPYVLALVLNLLLTLAAGLMYDFLWRWQYSGGGGNVYRRAAWISFPPLAFIYVCELFLSSAGHWVYLLEVFSVLGGVFMAILVLRDESIMLSEWAKRFLLQTTMAITIVLTGIGLAGLVMVYWDPSLLILPDHTLIRSWNVDFNALGYPPSEFWDRARIGVVWSALAAIIYLVVFIGGSLMVTIYRKDSGDSVDEAAALAPSPAAAPSRRRRSKRSQVDARYRPGWLGGHSILQPVRSSAGYPPY